MATFLNNRYTDTATGLISDANDRMVINPHYMYNQMKPVQCIFYNLSVEGSGYDVATYTEYAIIGPRSPFKFNKIKNCTLYANDLRVLLNLDYSENGLETAGPIEFELVVIPNTFVPYQNSLISFDQLRANPYTKNYLFVVDQVDPDTFENGANSYRIRCHLYTTGGKGFNGTSEFDLPATDLEYLENQQVVQSYVMNIENAGTDIKCVLTEEDANSAESLSDVTAQMKDFYTQLFWNNPVQSFTYETPNGFYYDPYMIEFIIRNRLFDTSNNGYIYVHHELKMPPTFAIDYNESYFRAIEKRDLAAFTDRYAYGQLITNINTLFVTVPQRYFAVIYDKPCLFGTFQPLQAIMTYSAHSNTIYLQQDEYAMYNIITQWFNEGTIPNNTIDILSKVHWEPIKEHFYFIPICIYVIDQYLKGMISNKS